MIIYIKRGYINTCESLKTSLLGRSPQLAIEDGKLVILVGSFLVSIICLLFHCCL